MTNLKPTTGETVIPTHIKQAKDIYKSRLESLGAYTCCDNVRPSLFIAPPTEELCSRGSEDNVEVFGGSNTGCSHKLTKKAPKKLSKGPPISQPQPSSRSSGKGSSWVEQKELIHDFLSGHIRKERDLTQFQQQAQLTSLTHEFESSQAKEHQNMVLMEKLEKKCNELYQVQLENIRLQ